MKKQLTISLLTFVAILVAVSAEAIPRLQTCVAGATYALQGRLDGSWMTHTRSFQVDVVGGFDNGWRLRKRITRDYMETYLVIGVPRGESGAIFVNGTQLNRTDFNNATPSGFYMALHRVQYSPKGRLDLHFYRLGITDNSDRNAVDFRPDGSITEMHWGDILTADVTVRGYSYARFGAAGIDGSGFNHVNHQTRDSSFEQVSASATPEPGTLSMLGAGLLALVPILRRRAKR